jgi:hypothetical protein
LTKAKELSYHPAARRKYPCNIVEFFGGRSNSKSRFQRGLSVSFRFRHRFSDRFVIASSRSDPDSAINSVGVPFGVFALAGIVTSHKHSQLGFEVRGHTGGGIAAALAHLSRAQVLAAGRDRRRQHSACCFHRFSKPGLSLQSLSPAPSLEPLLSKMRNTLSHSEEH